MRVVYFLTLTLFSFKLCKAQCPVSNFNLAIEHCIDETLAIENNSTLATSYSWDFCANDDLKNVPSSYLITTGSLSSCYDVDAEIDNGNIIAFVPARSNNSLVRINFGTSIGSSPLVENLGSFSNLLNSPTGIDVFWDGIGWHAIITGDTSSEIYLLSFGNSLLNTPNIVEISSGMTLNVPTAVKIVRENNQFYAFIVNASSSNVVLIDFGNSINETFTFSEFSFAGINSGTAIDIVKECDHWVGFLVARSQATLFKLDFGDQISNTPVITDVSSHIGFSLNDPLGLSIDTDGTGYQGFVTSRNGPLYRFDFSTLNDSPTAIDLGNFMSSSRDFGVDLVKNGSKWDLLMANFQGRLYNIDFDNVCESNIQTSISFLPEEKIYFESGGFSNKVSLSVYDTDEIPYISTQSTIISNNTAPAISFTTSSNECIGQSNTFTPIDGGGLTYEWSFNGGTTIGSTAISPTHTFSQVGDSVVVLTVNDGTCSNLVQDTISIYPEPVTPTFTPPVAPICTGAELTFTNDFDETAYVGATLTYAWDYNGEGSSSDKDGAFTFDTDGSKTVTLTASIPGCATSSAEPDIDLIAGPNIDFSIQDKCLGDVTQFTNLTSGSGITGETWIYGDGDSFASGGLTSPTHKYTASGNYEVSLTVANNLGCSNELVLPLTIDDKPVANFAYGPPCEEAPVQFVNESTSGAFANIENYHWDFGGLGTSAEEDPIFTFDQKGIYPVELRIESTFGCKDTVSQNVNVKLSPMAAFSIDLGCLDAATQFIDQTETEVENPINTWYWNINGDILPNTQNPIAVYSTPGDYTATLTVTPSNLCTSTVSQGFTIHDLPAANFTVDNNCDNEFTVFEDASTSATTNVVAYNWTFGEESTGNSNPALINFETAGNYEVSLTAIDDIGCEGIVQKTVTIYASPTANFIASTDIGSAPLTIDFTNQSNDADSYLWTFEDTTPVTSTEINPQHTYLTLGDYNASLISSTTEGCSDTLTIPITVAEPILDLELVQITTEEQNGKTNLTLTVKNSGNVTLNGFDIRIDLDNQSSIYESYEGTLLRNQIITYPLNFSFASTANNIGYTCITVEDLDEEFEDINIQNNEGCIDFAQELVVENAYPNPAGHNASNIRLNMILPAKGPVQILLLDATGAILYEDIYTGTTAGLNSFFIDIAPYNQGMYFIRVIYDQTESTQRFVKS
ncbi:PKD domain-containing protein [Reichenbachiella carrageenanivorans]|uniref:PKD domain-containing protein n=1 Tax=Reichenbachiella carrageenanivorans TaxID=2979869 RepID=A0ABY6D4L5_9BACT|nr:PKD domain-containing protein [Reichenbachiella carrageenanivorans]UXX81102.1 PKD domain-containing protein [Reichenbachiella carrageenanivorans]